MMCDAVEEALKEPATSQFSWWGLQHPPLTIRRNIGNHMEKLHIIELRELLAVKMYTELFKVRSDATKKRSTGP